MSALREVFNDDLAIEAFNAVIDINDTIDDGFWTDKSIPDEIQKMMEDRYYNYQLEFKSNGNCCAIDFLGAQLWNSEDDDRKYDDDNDCHAESIKEYLLKEMGQILVVDMRLIERYITK